MQKLAKEYGNQFLPLGTKGKMEEKKEYPCKYCDTILPHKLALKLHLKNTHSDMYSFNCEKCNRVYMSEQSLKLHLKINHNGNTTATCGWCYKKFSHKIKLYDHKKFCTKRPTGDNVPKILCLEDTIK